MDEIRSAYGLLNLKQVDDAIAKRKATAEKYREALKDVPGVRCLQDIEGVRHNYAYFPIFISEEYGLSRDALYEKLKEHNVYGRRYFYPLISTFSAYKGLESADPKNLPVAHKLADQVLCLPMFAGVSDTDAERVVDIIVNKG
jgi:dTDP-4-amino-4,6-dideoxygalactose transaminase